MPNVSRRVAFLFLFATIVAIAGGTSARASISDAVRGRILLQVEQHGEAWYVPPALGTRYYLKDGAAAYEALRSFGLGITDADLAKVPVAGGSTAGADAAVVNRLRGYILLQVERHGEAWYVHPTDGTRTYLKDGDAAYAIMRLQSLGITDADLARVPVYGPSVAFFYQYVGKFANGLGSNGVRLGLTTDGEEVTTTGLEAVSWKVGTSAGNGYGDPVFSRLSDGNWAMTAWSNDEDSRGAGTLLYHESACPVVVDANVVAIGPSTASGCEQARSLTVGKSSQIFDADGDDYVFHSTGGDLFLARLTDGDRKAGELDSMCVLKTPVTSLSDLDYGESTKVLDGSVEGLLFSDSAIGRRADGTWVLFAKGIASDSGCKQGTLCELCGRSIYRSTSVDLIEWSTPEEVVEQASVPEAHTAADGTVWLYHQDFSDACEADDLHLANVAPITGHYETAGSYKLSDPVRTTYPDEAFQSDSTVHYATNGNPVTLPDAAAVAALEACVGE